VCGKKKKTAIVAAFATNNDQMMGLFVPSSLVLSKVWELTAIVAAVAGDRRMLFFSVLASFFLQIAYIIIALCTPKIFNTVCDNTIMIGIL
jgi:hypothetical protein